MHRIPLSLSHPSILKSPTSLSLCLSHVNQEQQEICASYDPIESSSIFVRSSKREPQRVPVVSHSLLPSWIAGVCPALAATLTRESATAAAEAASARLQSQVRKRGKEQASSAPADSLCRSSNSNKSRDAAVRASASEAEPNERRSRSRKGGKLLADGQRNRWPPLLLLRLLPSLSLAVSSSDVEGERSERRTAAVAAPSTTLTHSLSHSHARPLQSSSCRFLSRSLTHVVSASQVVSCVRFGKKLVADSHSLLISHTTRDNSKQGSRRGPVAIVRRPRALTRPPVHLPHSVSVSPAVACRQSPVKRRAASKAS